MPDDTLAARMFFALNEAERRAGRRKTLSEIGDGMAQRLGKPTGAYDPSVVRRQLKGVEPRTVPERVALAQELGVDPGWLYFGSASAAPVPAGWEVTRSPGGALEARIALIAAEGHRQDRDPQEDLPAGVKPGQKGTPISSTSAAAKKRAAAKKSS